MENEIRKMERKFAPFIQKVIQENLGKLPVYCTRVEESTEYEDCNLSFDLRFRMETHVSIRLRNFDAIIYDDITIRTRSKGGFACEIDKIIKGEGQIYFYGVLDENEYTILKWVLFDIDKIRTKLKSNGSIRTNRDKTEFRCYEIDWLKENDAVIAEKQTEFVFDSLFKERLKKYGIKKQVEENNKKFKEYQFIKK